MTIEYINNKTKYNINITIINHCINYEVPSHMTSKELNNFLATFQGEIEDFKEKNKHLLDYKKALKTFNDKLSQCTTFEDTISRTISEFVPPLERVINPKML